MTNDNIPQPGAYIAARRKIRDYARGKSQAVQNWAAVARGQLCALSKTTDPGTREIIKGCLQYSMKRLAEAQ